MAKEELGLLQTEQRNPGTENIDKLSTIDMVKLINGEDKKVAEAVEKVLPQIAAAVDVISERMSRGGRLIYCGAGTSGRLGVLDAAECPPTFSAEPEKVVGLIAGGEKAMFRAVEGAEDDPELGKQDMINIGLSEKDTLVGIAASGRTPYVLGALAYANEVGAATVSLSCCPGSAVTKAAEINIAPAVGAEVITGSTRMKSGTAQKMVLNMLSTGTMVKLGKVYGNLMVDVKASNEKLVNRCERIVSMACDVDIPTAKTVLSKCDYHPKTAIVMLKCGVDSEKAASMLEAFGGKISDVLASLES